MKKLVKLYLPYRNRDVIMGFFPKALCAIETNWRPWFVLYRMWWLIINRDYLVLTLVLWLNYHRCMFVAVLVILSRRRDNRALCSFFNCCKCFLIYVWACACNNEFFSCDKKVAQLSIADAGLALGAFSLLILMPTGAHVIQDTMWKQNNLAKAIFLQLRIRLTILFGASC